MTREAFYHEVSSVGFRPGSGDIPDAAFYSYAVPAPQGFKDKQVRPNSAGYNKQLGEVLLMYDDVRKTESPVTALLDFDQSTYEPTAAHGNSDRSALER